MLELGLLDSKMNQYPPSLLASTALYVSLRVMLGGIRQGQPKIVSVWTSDLIENTGYKNTDMAACSKNYW